MAELPGVRLFHILFDDLGQEGGKVVGDGVVTVPHGVERFGGDPAAGVDVVHLTAVFPVIVGDEFAKFGVECAAERRDRNEQGTFP